MTSLIPWSTLSILAVVFACVAGLVVAILLPILHHVRLWRELAHKERMKAADVGQPMHQEDPTKLDKQSLYNSYWIAFWLGGGFPIAAVGAAAWITSAGHLQHLGYLLAVWCSVAAANMTSVICAAVVILGSGRKGRGQRGAGSDPQASRLESFMRPSGGP